ncbi:hypothetical protein MTR67_000248 [Solanum verrucosum]|uniref:Bromo domain-containing protein n=1 Tax=Solanum verrucosum TaxID=315347 RepID=A0AAF0T787_SOLVR|nr:hypothetical protein MTR67_000248 [Solanum verrucosum]
MEKLQVQDDLLLACSVRRHGLDKWEMVAAEFSKAIFHFRRCVLNISSVECQIKKILHNLYRLEAEKRIADEEKGNDTSNDKMHNIDQDFIGVLDVLRSHKYCCLFESRLSCQESDPDFRYIKQIKQHMDLQIIQNKLEQGVYSNMKFASFFRDLLLMFNNAIVYYPKDTLQYSTAFELRAIVREMEDDIIVEEDDVGDEVLALMDKEDDDDPNVECLEGHP